MFRIERNIVNVGAEKNHHVILETSLRRLENFCFTFIDAKEYAASEKWHKIFICILTIVVQR
jgi:hypothetical protein